MVRLFKVTLTGNNGNTIVRVGKPYKYVCVMNHTSDANLIFAGGSFQSVPGDTIEVPAGADISFPIDVLPGDWNLSVWWDAGAGDTVNVYCSDEPIYLGQGKPAGTTVTNTVTVSGNVSVSGPVDIGTMPAVDINSSSGSPVYVSVSSSVTLNIAGNVGITGNVNIGSMPSVSISSSSGAPVYVSVSSSVTLNANLTNSVINVAFPSAQQVTLAATGPVNVTNEILQSQSTVLVGKNLSIIVTNLTNGSGFRGDNNDASGTFDPVLADGLYAVWHSVNGHAYTPKQGAGWVAGNWPSKPTGFAYTGAGITYDPQWFANVGGDGSAYFAFGQPVQANQAFFYLYNETGVTIANDTVYVSVWLVKGQQQLNNLTSSPANIQPGQGSFDTLSGNNGGQLSLNQSVTIVASGNYIKTINFAGCSGTVEQNTGNSGTVVMTLWNGGQVLAQTSVFLNTQTSATLALPAKTYDFGNGVACNGIILQVQVTSGSVGVNSGPFVYGPIPCITASNTPPSKVGSIV